jgi:uncharacterized membrane protein
MRRLYRVLSLGFGIAGFTKIMAVEPQKRMFRSWGWSETMMLAVGGLELGGAVLMSSRRTRQIGAATVAATSIAVLTAELEHGQKALSNARLAVLLAAATALV